MDLLYDDLLNDAIVKHNFPVVDKHMFVVQNHHQNKYTVALNV
jgi:hypothetical protein